MFEANAAHETLRSKAATAISSHLPIATSAIKIACNALKMKEQRFA
jgi:hypothetical protein